MTNNLSILKEFPKEFIFGAASSSYQIEGSSFGDCGASHWDTFAAQPGRTFNGENGSIACDHYHKWQEDLDLVAGAGFDSYRFSMSWARLLPEDNKVINPQGLSFYDRLIDGMLERGLKPFLTLYHWDLPVRYANKGGWQNRDTAGEFANYASIVAKHFGDRISHTATINEPWCVAWLSHFLGDHAPGLTDIGATAKVMHNIQLAHGMAIETLRSMGIKNLGAVLNKEYAQPIDNTDLAIQKAHLYDGIYNRWFEESILLGKYPSEVVELFDGLLPDNYEDDMKVISLPLDWIGVNYYTRTVIEPDNNSPHTGFKCVRGDLPKTDMDWEVYPGGLSFFVRRLYDTYGVRIPIFITENGAAFSDVCENGSVDDQPRIDYYDVHLQEVLKMIQDGIPVKGYFAWSILDNYEWALGYSKRFGLVFVDYKNQNRTPKNSWHEFRENLIP